MAEAVGSDSTDPPVAYAWIAISRQHPASGGVRPTDPSLFRTGREREASCGAIREKKRLIKQPLLRSHRRLRLERILDHVAPLESFVSRRERLVRTASGSTKIEVDIEPRANGRAICSKCGEKRPGSDRLPAHRFEFVPCRTSAVLFVYAMRRVECPTCGVVVGQMPWAEGKEQMTTSYRWFLARWAKRLSWQGAADACNTTWDTVFRSVQHAVEWGLAHRDLSAIEAIGVDEMPWGKSPACRTLVYQNDTVKWLLWVAEERTEKSLRGFFESLTAEVTAGIQFQASAVATQDRQGAAVCGAHLGSLARLQLRASSPPPFVHARCHRSPAAWPRGG